MEKVLVLDFGGQYDLLIARRVRENGVFAEVLSYDRITPAEIKAAGYNQLRSLGIVDRGEIAVGQVADLVLLDDSLSPRMTSFLMQ